MAQRPRPPVADLARRREKPPGRPSPVDDGLFDLARPARRRPGGARSRRGRRRSARRTPRSRRTTLPIRQHSRRSSDALVAAGGRLPIDARRSPTRRRAGRDPRGLVRPCSGCSTSTATPCSTSSTAARGRARPRPARRAVPAGRSTDGSAGQPGAPARDHRRPAPRHRAPQRPRRVRRRPRPLRADRRRGAGGLPRAARRRSRRSAGEYGSGKTFFARWLAERAKARGFAIAEVQISETETPLHRLETVYRRLCERLSTARRHAGRVPAGRRRLVLRPRGGRPGRRRVDARRCRRA